MSEEAGFAAHLTKPIQFQTLEATMRQVASANDRDGLVAVCGSGWPARRTGRNRGHNLTATDGDPETRAGRPMPDFLTNLFDSSELHAAPVLRELDRGARLAPRRVRRPDLAGLCDDPGRAGLFRPAAPRLPFPWLFWMFGAFIITCGFTHLLEAAAFWWPAYRLMGVSQVDHGRDVVGHRHRADPDDPQGAGPAESGGTPDGDRRVQAGGGDPGAAGATARGHPRFDHGPGHGRQDHLLEPRGGGALRLDAGGGPGEPRPRPAADPVPRAAGGDRGRAHPRGGLGRGAGPYQARRPVGS